MRHCRYRADGVEVDEQALSDLVRLYEFLAPVNKGAAARAVQSLTRMRRKAPSKCA
jgi:hypothetical protein